MELKTPLYDRHVACGGKIVPFAGYLLLSLGALVSSKVPLRFALVRSAAVLPFALAVGVFVPFITPGTSVWEFHTGFLDVRMTAEGLVRFSSLLLKVIVSFFATLTRRQIDALATQHDLPLVTMA